MPTPPLILIGAMSGTSADGIDLILAEFPNRAPASEAGALAGRVRLLAHYHHDYPASLRATIHTARQAGATASVEASAELTRQITLNYVEGVAAVLGEAGLSQRQVSAIAAHGQTMFHRPPLSVQVLDAPLLAVRSQIPVVSSFRGADLAADGQGAPLVPMADWLLFGDRSDCRLMLNVGGIANVTLLPGGDGGSGVIAFDTGPGNCLSDLLCRRFRPEGPGFDVGGAGAAAGRPIEAVVARVLEHPFFHQPPPRSTDVPQMVDAFLAAARIEQDARRPDDLLATACLISARAIARAVERYCRPRPRELFVAGGGIGNDTLMRMIAAETGLVPRSTETLGVPPAAREALAFAALAHLLLNGRAGNLPSVTGAVRPVLLGTITPSADRLPLSAGGIE